MSSGIAISYLDNISGVGADVGRIESKVLNFNGVFGDISGDGTTGNQFCGIDYATAGQKKRNYRNKNQFFIHKTAFLFSLCHNIP